MSIHFYLEPVDEDFEAMRIRNLLKQGSFVVINESENCFSELNDPRVWFCLLDPAIDEFGAIYVLSSVSIPYYAYEAFVFCVEFWKRTEVARKWGELIV